MIDREIDFCYDDGERFSYEWAIAQAPTNNENENASSTKIEQNIDDSRTFCKIEI
jgi:hypothetical protein